MKTQKSGLMWLLLAGGLSLSGLASCASPGRIQDAASRDEMKAQQLEAEGDPVGAAKARAAAAKERQKAAERATWYQ